VAFLSLPNISLKGISAAVPLRMESNLNFDLISLEERDNLISTTGILERRMADESTCTSDLCYAAAIKLIEELGWEKESIDVLVFVSQTADYIYPATAPILQSRLGLSNSCMAFDISMGCSGYIYGLNVLGSLISHGSIKRGILLVGDTISKTCSKEDKSTYPLFGDAGTATAIEYDSGNVGIRFNLSSDGMDFKAIRIEDGGFRNQASKDSFKVEEYAIGVKRNRLQMDLDGMNVFSFGINKAPQSVMELIGKYDLDINTIDYFVFHQANLFMNELIRQKLKLIKEKVPYSLNKFGNTSSATIPLTLAATLRDKLLKEKLSLILCGFGVGLSWGSAHLFLDRIKCPDIIEI
jgi:3-oxoacyl-[acyl-carrier-protein] synthase III